MILISNRLVLNLISEDNKEEDLQSIQEGLEIILGEEFNRYGGRADSQSEIVSGNSDKSIRPYTTERDGENLRSLKRAFEEILYS